MIAHCDQDAAPDTVRARSRRTVAATILSAFHFACDVKEVAVARQLLAALEAKLHEEKGRGGSDNTRVLESLVAGHERLWTLRTTIL